MNSIIKNFAQWQALYEAEMPVQPIEKDKPLPENQAKAFAQIGSAIMKRLCLTLLAKSETVTGYLDPSKDPTGTKEIGTGTYKYFPTAPFIDTDNLEPLSNVNPAPNVDPATFGTAADQVSLTATRAAEILKGRGVPVPALDKIDLSSAKSTLDSLIASSGKRVGQTGYGAPALQHPMFPLGGEFTDKGNIKRTYDDILMKDFSYDGGRIMRSSDRLAPNSRGMTISLSKSAGDKLIQIATEIINAIVPADLQNVRDLMIRAANPSNLFGLIQKKGLSRAELATGNSASNNQYYPKQSPAYTVKGYDDAETNDTPAVAPNGTAPAAASPATAAK